MVNELHLYCAFQPLHFTMTLIHLFTHTLVHQWLAADAMEQQHDGAIPNVRLSVNLHLLPASAWVLSFTTPTPQPAVGESGRANACLWPSDQLNQPSVGADIAAVLQASSRWLNVRCQ